MQWHRVGQSSGPAPRREGGGAAAELRGVAVGARSRADGDGKAGTGASTRANDDGKAGTGQHNGAAKLRAVLGSGFGERDAMARRARRRSKGKIE
jgi:hypothetical protein